MSTNTQKKDKQKPENYLSISLNEEIFLNKVEWRLNMLEKPQDFRKSCIIVENSGKSKWLPAYMCYLKRASFLFYATWNGLSDRPIKKNF